jgi:6-phosphogluconolactonase (cycloisomerase 2 family)
MPVLRVVRLRRHTSGPIDRSRRRLVWMLAVAALLAEVILASTSVPGISAFSATSTSPGNLFAARFLGLVQQQHTAACVSQTGTSGGCVDGEALSGAFAVALSPDGTSAYVAADGSDSVAVFSRNTSTGALTQLSGTAGCVSESGTAGTCVNGNALSNANGVAVSPDGTSVYVTARISDSVAVFSRDTSTGELSQLSGTAGCVSESGTGGTCVDGKALDGAEGVVVSPDGAYVYVGSVVSDAVAAFSRDPATGELSQLSGTAGCVSNTGTSGTCATGRFLDGVFGLAISPDGANVYAAAANSSSVAVFTRDDTTGQLTQPAGVNGCISDTGSSGACFDGAGLAGVNAVAVTADGAHVYSAGGAVSALIRDPGTGALTQSSSLTSCISESGSSGTCQTGRALTGPTFVAVSPDGSHVYAVAENSDSVVVLSRDPSTGAITQSATTDGCVRNNDSSCVRATALDGPAGVTVSPDGDHVYVASVVADSVLGLTRTSGTGGLIPIGVPGCISEDNTAGTCLDGVALKEPVRAGVSPDGKHLYVASFISDAVAALSRDPDTGALTRLAGTDACISETGGADTCLDGTGLDGAWDLAISPDGNFVYVASKVSDAVGVFSRNPTTGALTQLAGTDACVSLTGSGGACATGTALDGANALAISPDGAYLYVGSIDSDAVTVFSRNTSTGVLTQLTGADRCVSLSGTGGACVTGTALDGVAALQVSPDGGHLYVAASASGAVAAFSRNTGTGALTQLAGTDACVSNTGTSGACVDGNALAGAYDVTVSPDNGTVYIAAFTSNAVAVLSRNTSTGALTQLSGTAGCVSETGDSGACADGVALAGAQGVAVSADGLDVYVAANTSDAVVVFERNPTTGALTQWPGIAGCHSESGTGGVCTDVRAVDGMHRVTVSPDDAHVYTSGTGSTVTGYISVFTRS